MNPVVRLWLSVSTVVFVLLAGTVGYVIVEHQPALDSLYMTVITLSTVGFKEVFELDRGGRILTMLIILLGYAALYLSLANLVSLIVGGELRAIRGRLRMKAQINQLEDHVIICGFGRMGSLVAAQLTREEVSCVAIDNSATHGMESQGVLFVQGDATEDSDLLEAGLMRARALVTCLSGDADNVYVTLTARELRSDLQIIARAQQPSTEPKLKRAGADSVICPQTIGANKTVGLLCKPHVIELVDMAAKGVDIEIAQYQVSADSSLVDKPLRESGIRERAGMMVVAIKRADGFQIFSPGPEETIQEADRLILIGRGGLSERLNELHL